MTNEFIPKGWRLVPIEMTAEMRVAFNEADERWEDGYGVKPNAQYLAAIHAAPNPPVEDTWQDISTAPKDGRDILTYSPSGWGIVVTNWYADRWFTGFEDHADMGNYKPTKWMPCPKQPGDKPCKI